MDEDEIINEPVKKDSYCPRCGLRSYDDICQNCGAPIIDKTDDEEEEWDWRETKR
jgi:ribosomal protein L37E